MSSNTCHSACLISTDEIQIMLRCPCKNRTLFNIILQLQQYYASTPIAKLKGENASLPLKIKANML